MNKIMTILVSFFMFLSFFSVTIYAESGEVATVNFKVVNEFLAVKETAEKIKKQLEITPTTSQDYSSMASEYKEIVNFRDKFIDQKKYLKTLSDSELKIFNYSDVQIANIRSDDYSDLSLAASSAILTDYIKIDASDTFYASNLKRFYLRTRAYWSWSGYPIMRNTDKYSAAISGDSIFHYISSIFYVEYTIPGYPTIGKTDSSIVYNADSSIIYKFPLQRNGLVTGQPAIYGYALYGYLDYYAMADYYDEPGLIYSIGSYGHQYFTGTANLSFAPFPAVEFNVGLTTEFVGNKPKCTYDKNLSSGLVTYNAGSWGSGSLYGSCSR